MREIKELERLLAQRERQLLELQQRMRELEHRVLNDLAGLSLHLFSQSQRSRQPEQWSECIAQVDASIEMCKLQSTEPRDKTASITIEAARYLLAVTHELQRALAGVLKIDTSMDPDVLLEQGTSRVGWAHPARSRHQCSQVCISERWMWQGLR